MKQILVAIFILFSLSIYSSEDFPTLINPDGTLKFREFTKEQKDSYEFIKKQIDYYHAEIAKYIPYLIREKKIKKNQYFRQFRNYTETEIGTRKKLHIIDSFTLRLNGDKLQGIDFKKMKAIISTNRDQETIVKSISNDLLQDDFANLHLKIENFDSDIDPKKSEVQTFVMKSMISPLDRLKVLRSYRNKVEEALRELDKQIDHKAVMDNAYIKNTIKEIELE